MPPAYFFANAAPNDDLSALPISSAGAPQSVLEYVQMFADLMRHGR